jgi:hypothetical protein
MYFNDRLLGDVKVFVAHCQAQQQDLHDQLAVPGTQVYVLRDGRTGWMRGAQGTVESTGDQLASIRFQEGAVRRFPLKRISRHPNGFDCWRAKLAYDYHRASR